MPPSQKLLHIQDESSFIGDLSSELVEWCLLFTVDQGQPETIDDAVNKVPAVRFECLFRIKENLTSVGVDCLVALDQFELRILSVRWSKCLCLRNLRESRAQNGDRDNLRKWGLQAVTEVFERMVAITAQHRDTFEGEGRIERDGETFTSAA